MSQDCRKGWLLNLGKRMGLTTLEFNETGVCQLILDKELILTIYKPDDTDKLVLFSQIHTPPLPIEVAKQMLKKKSIKCQTVCTGYFPFSRRRCYRSSSGA